MNNLLEQIDFGNEAADDITPKELLSFFIEQSMFHEFADSKHKIRIATAKKGVGKSALLQWTLYKINQKDPEAIVVKCRGADLVRSNFKLKDPLTTPNDYINDWMVRICAIINRELAKRLKFAFTDDEIGLVEAAEIGGYKSRNLISCLLDRFQLKLSVKKVPTQNEIEVLKRVKNRKVWILIDDLDATFQNTKTESLELSTFFSACRYLTQDLSDISFRITMRTDVWSILRRFDEALDKMEQYVKDITWHQKDFRQLLHMRVKTEMEKREIPIKHSDTYSQEEMEEYIINYVFIPKMIWGKDEEKYTYRVIYTLSYARPRWAIQLCKLAQKDALKCGDKKISKKHIDNVWGEYGNKRIADLVSEHKHQCNEIQDLLNAFRGSERQLTRDELLVLIKNRITNHLSPIIEGESIKSPLEIAKFLYRLGFIIARSEHDEGKLPNSDFIDNEKIEYEHYHFHEMPDFLSSKTDNDFGVKWEIHPCYRQALDIVKLNRFQREKRRRS